MGSICDNGVAFLFLVFTHIIFLGQSNWISRLIYGWNIISEKISIDHLNLKFNLYIIYLKV